MDNYALKLVAKSAALSRKTVALTVATHHFLASMKNVSMASSSIFRPFPHAMISVPPIRVLYLRMTFWEMNNAAKNKIWRITSAQLLHLSTLKNALKVLWLQKLLATSVQVWKCDRNVTTLIYNLLSVVFVYFCYKLLENQWIIVKKIFERKTPSTIFRFLAISIH